MSVSHYRTLFCIRWEVGEIAHYSYTYRKDTSWQEEVRFLCQIIILMALIFEQKHNVDKTGNVGIYSMVEKEFLDEQDIFQVSSLQYILI